ncbi:acyltransferase [Epilithonimonas hispanica]|uniref:Acyltransferase n=1 Tax=Epilithonimonas hispanica TaxID=358687 RepID=A0A3D9D5J7_9FLAO|nr:acyltransferase [Epilithonimonas hispanica]REC73254.1 acyltransferase [Epilithonimonas hispanica]
MTFLKVLFRLNCFFKLILFKLIYGDKISFGRNVTFRKQFSLVIDGKNAKVNIGDNVFFNNFCTIAAMENITIGKNTIFGENVKIYDHNHLYKDINIPIKNQGYSTSKIIIGENCWIASNVMILKGVTIGNHVVIGAGNTVYKDVPDNSVLLSKHDQILKSIL